MRFVVFLDLLSTVVRPITVGYIVYLIYLIFTGSDIILLTFFLLLGAIYGLQVIIFILRKEMGDDWVDDHLVTFSQSLSSPSIFLCTPSGIWMTSRGAIPVL